MPTPWKGPIDTVTIELTLEQLEELQKWAIDACKLHKGYIFNMDLLNEINSLIKLMKDAKCPTCGK
jgi:hypothetical protein